jgi:hypothetical protein
MSDRNVATTDQRQIDSRANLFYLLQTLAQHAQARANECKSCVESSITNEQIETYVSRNGLM